MLKDPIANKITTNDKKLQEYLQVSLRKYLPKKTRTAGKILSSTSEKIKKSILKEHSSPSEGKIPAIILAKNAKVLSRLLSKTP